jgi:hypothetical protein
VDSHIAVVRSVACHRFVAAFVWINVCHVPDSAPAFALNELKREEFGMATIAKGQSFNIAPFLPEWKRSGICIVWRRGNM